MCIAIALCVFIIVSGLTINNTVFNKNFVAKNLVTSKLEEECNEQLKLKFRVLEKKSNIPVKVFKKVIEDKPTAQIMTRNVDNFFSDRDASSNSEDMVSYFYKICTEYLDDNGIKYNENDIRNVAVEATKIYSDSVGFNNVAHLKLFVDEREHEILKSMSYAIGILVAACILLHAMYSDTKKAFKVMSQSIIASGVAGIVVAIISVAMGYGLDLPISPDIYMQSFNHLLTAGYKYFALASFGVLVVGVVLTVIIQRHIDREKYRREIRFSKRIDNM